MLNLSCLALSLTDDHSDQLDISSKNISKGIVSKECKGSHAYVFF